MSLMLAGCEWSSSRNGAIVVFGIVQTALYSHCTRMASTALAVNVSKTRTVRVLYVLEETEELANGCRRRCWTQT